MSPDQRPPSVGELHDMVHGGVSESNVASRAIPLYLGQLQMALCRRDMGMMDVLEAQLDAIFEANPQLHDQRRLSD